MSSLKKIMLVVLSGLAMGMGPGIHAAWSAGLVSEVSVSADCKRLIVQTDGQAKVEQIFSMNRPSRLVVDLKDTRFGGKFKRMKFEDRPIREVRIASRGMGTRLVVEFSGDVVPAHRVREIDDHLIILLGAFLAPSPGDYVDRENSATNRGKSGPGLRVSPDDRGLKIKSACVSNGMIVLDVTEDSHPDRQFRIDLGVDLKELGFRSAEIRRTKHGLKSSSETTTARKESPSRAHRIGISRGSARLGLGSLHRDKRTKQKGLFDVAKLKRKRTRIASCHVMPVVKECGYSPEQDRSTR